MTGTERLAKRLQIHWTPEQRDSLAGTPYFIYRDGDKQICLDGGFTAQQLRVIASYMEDPDTP